ncbi:hypothetical protein FS837_006105 [Tulasnella sp. UAMH 9824]|nr:hypothetical protein FS837_006105 [Tulasnella sp. UAMH 9824]
MADAESISLEETNKIRISLGLKPLTDDKATADSKEQTAEENYAKRREQERKEKETSAVAARIAKARNKLELNRRLVGATLGEAEDTLDDAKAWIKRSKKKEKELAAKRQAELDSRDALDSEAYTEKDLEGLKVSHDFEDMEEGEARILTLKDSRILDNEEDELHNIDMAEVEKDKKRHELKTKRRDYTGYDDDEFAAGGDGLKRSVLAKYDEDLHGAPEKGFRLGSGIPQARQTAKDVHEQQATAVNKSLLSIDYAKNQEISDYAVEGEKGFKKPKTKKKKSSRRMPADAELGGGDEDVKPDVGMQVDVPQPEAPRQRDLDANFIDDEDLQAALSRARRQKVKRTKVSPEEIAARLAQEKAEEEARLVVQESAATNGDSLMTDVKKEEEDESGLVFDDTTEFVRAIQYDPTAKPEPKKPEPISITIRTARSPSVGAGDEAVAEMDVDANGAHDDDDSGNENEDEVLNIIANAIAESSANAQAVKAEQDDDELGTKVETFGSGLGGTLNILRKQGIVGKSSEENRDREATQLEHDKWLGEHRQRLAQRELERMRSKGSNKDQVQREYENKIREQQEAREQMEAFKNYKPDVEIKYYDEFGREMDRKEAWKALSHRFHGKGSGKMKTEKRLKKIADEKKREAMISGDTPTSMNEAFQKRQEKVGQAHMVLSVGNRGAVPQLEEYLDNAALSKVAKATKGKGKKKDAGTKTPVQAVDMTAFATTNSYLAPGIVPLPLSSTTSSAEGSPAPPVMMKPAFTRISSAAESAVPTPSGSGGASPLGTSGERTKVKIGFGLKRKALDEGVETPPPKR